MMIDAERDVDAPVLPNLLVIGVQKGGTTWLHRLLDSHPDVFMSERKELEYFSKQDVSLSRYSQNFTTGRESRYRGESTPGYFKSPHRQTSDVATAAKATLGDDARLVIVFRDPVERAISAYLHHWRQGRLRGDESILDCGNCIVETGFYDRHARDWLEVFGRDNFFFCTTDQLVDPAPLTTELARWLAIPAFPVPPKPVHVGSRTERDGAFLTVTAESLQRFRARNTDRALRRPRIRIDELLHLEELYAPQTEFVSSICGRRVPWPAWRPNS